ncbi:MAG TPA: cupin domain-containing protein [Caulobacteraceae bacterium]|nr:cupin domain-containing protein [Caulobacteraceae bacterium]
MPTPASEIIRRLALQPHPEGGWYRETWRDRPVDGRRGAGTSILFLLEAGQRSHWHRIDATELWLFQAGDPLRLQTASGADIAECRLGSNVLGGDQLQAWVAPGEWQAAQALGAWSLVACVVMPAFDFAHFELAPPGWEPG